METKTAAHQPEPNDEVSIGADGLLPGDASHSVRSVTWMNKKGGGPGFWMVLQSMSSGS